MLPERFGVYKKNSICDKKSGAVTKKKKKMVTKIKRHNQLYLGTLVLALY